MSKTCTIYIVRHGESVANRDGISGSDAELTDLGRQQAQETKQLLFSVTFDAVFSSDLIRAVETAEIISGKAVPKEHQLRGLRERDFGYLENGDQSIWLGIKDEYEAKYAKLPFVERIEHEYAEGIEGDKSIVDRCMAGLRAIAQEYPSGTVLLASHAGPIRNLLMYLGYADFLTVGSFRNAGYVKLQYDGTTFQVAEVVGVEL